MAEETITEEQIAKNYAAMLDSVNFINGSKLSSMSDDMWNEMVENNKEHLRIMVAKDYWTSENMTSVNAAIGS